MKQNENQPVKLAITKLTKTSDTITIKTGMSVKTELKGGLGQGLGPGTPGHQMGRGCGKGGLLPCGPEM